MIINCVQYQAVKYNFDPKLTNLHVIGKKPIWGNVTNVPAYNLNTKQKIFSEITKRSSTSVSTPSSML